MGRNFREMLEARWAKGNFVCVGLDSDLQKIPESSLVRCFPDGVDVVGSIVAFNRAIVEATKDLVCAYKPNVAFYEKQGCMGIEALRQSIADIKHIAPNVPVILDAKRADIGNTNAGYADSAFDFFHADAITVHPYLGAEALKPFLDRSDKGVIVLCRTSNPGAGEFQDRLVIPTWEDEERWCLSSGPRGEQEPTRMPLYQYIAHAVANDWNKNHNCAVVVGATYPEELRAVRTIVGDMPILIPGIGSQGGDVEKTVSAGKDSRGQGVIINSSRGIIFASKSADFAEVAWREAEKLHDLINQYR